MTWRAGLSAATTVIAVGIGTADLLISLASERLSNKQIAALDFWAARPAAKTFDDVLPTVNAEVMPACGELAFAQATALERLWLITFGRDELDFRVDVCVKMTVNRNYPQPEFLDTALVGQICGGKTRIFERICKHNGFTP